MSLILMTMRWNLPHPWTSRLLLIHLLLRSMELRAPLSQPRLSVASHILLVTTETIVACVVLRGRKVGGDIEIEVMGAWRGVVAVTSIATGNMTQLLGGSAQGPVQRVIARRGVGTVVMIGTQREETIAIGIVARFLVGEIGTSERGMGSLGSAGPMWAVGNGTMEAISARV